MNVFLKTFLEALGFTRPDNRSRYIQLTLLKRFALRIGPFVKIMDEKSIVQFDKIVQYLPLHGIHYMFPKFCKIEKVNFYMKKKNENL
jgi:hypothetical protein